MRKLIAIAALSLLGQQVMACMWPVFIKAGIEDARMPIPGNSPFYRLNALNAPPAGMKPVLHTPFATIIWAENKYGAFKTFRYDHAAYFCRMESYPQRKYGVKIMVHAGGYKERAGHR